MTSTSKTSDPTTSDLTSNTDSKPEHETDETPNPEDSRESSPADTDIPVADDPATSDTEAHDNTPRLTDGFAAGGAAVVSVGLGVSALTGTGIGDMMRARQEIVGQIDASVGGGGPIDQIDVIYGSPWHTAALVNFAVALVAVLIGCVLLIVHSNRPTSPTWVKALALGGAVLGGLGMLVTGGMFLDLFAAPPVLPQAPPLGG